MKYTLIGSVLFCSFGVAHAGSDWDKRQVEDTGNQGMQSTAVQPGIGDRANRFEAQDDRFMGFDHEDWSDLRNEEIYGSF